MSRFCYSHNSWLCEVGQGKCGPYDDEAWACATCGRHPQSGPNWCGAGCGRDYREMRRVPRPIPGCLPPVELEDPKP